MSYQLFRQLCTYFVFFRFPSILHFLDNTKLEHITAEDHKQFEESLLDTSAVFQKTYWLISIALEVGAFCLQFLEWWHTDQRSNTNMTSFTNSLAPPLPSQEKWRNKCPLCRSSNIQAPTILTTCGYVFCYRCIMTHLQENGKCPLSGISANNENLVRIFSK